MKRTKQKSPRFGQIANDLRTRIKADPSYAIPSMNELVRLFQASTLTISKAVRVLCDEGLVAVSRGRRIDRAEGKTRDSADEQVFRTMRQAIQDGEFRPGERMPKVGFFANSEHISRMSIVLGFRRLQDEQLIHKRGRSWIVGPRPVRQADVHHNPLGETGPSILLFCESIHKNVWGNGFLAPFLWTLQSELHDKCITVRMCSKTLESGLKNSSGTPQGHEEIARLIRAWGDFYRGAIILDPYLEAESAPRWIRTLSGGKRPVIFFDASDERDDLTRSELATTIPFYRMHLDESAAVSLALQRLTASGHRDIGIPIPSWYSGGWVQRRLGLCKRLAKRMSPLPDLIMIKQTEEFWKQSDTSPKSVSDFAQSIAASMPAGLKMKPKDYLRAAPSLESLLSKGATAIIAMNDWMAHLYQIWSVLAGIAVPGGLSTISFDNNPVTSMYPLTTVDFGFSRLGYLAARILCGAEPEDAGRSGTIPSIPFIVNRGSVGPPPVKKTSPHDGTGTRAQILAVNVRRTHQSQ